MNTLIYDALPCVLAMALAPYGVFELVRGQTRKMRIVGTLLIVWCVLLITPGARSMLFSLIEQPVRNLVAAWSGLDPLLRTFVLIATLAWALSLLL